jgi:hypothetical protein
VLSVVRYRSLWRADHLSREVLPTVMHRCVSSRNLKNEEAMAAPQGEKKTTTLWHEMPQPRITWGSHSGGDDEDSRPLGNDTVWSGKCLTRYTVCQSTQCRIVEDRLFNATQQGPCYSMSQFKTASFHTKLESPITMPQHSISFQPCSFNVPIISLLCTTIRYLADHRVNWPSERTTWY